MVTAQPEITDPPDIWDVLKYFASDYPWLVTLIGLAAWGAALWAAWKSLRAGLKSASETIDSLNRRRDRAIVIARILGAVILVPLPVFWLIMSLPVGSLYNAVVGSFFGGDSKGVVGLDLNFGSVLMAIYTLVAFGFVAIAYIDDGIEAVIDAAKWAALPALLCALPLWGSISDYGIWAAPAMFWLIHLLGYALAPAIVALCIALVAIPPEPDPSLDGDVERDAV